MYPVLAFMSSSSYLFVAQQPFTLSINPISPNFFFINNIMHKTWDPLAKGSSQTMDGFNSNPHFVLLPLMTQGHLLPMADMACLLAERGAVVTLITTPVNLSRIQSSVDFAKKSGLSVDFVGLPFPYSDTTLPDGCESVDLIPSDDLIKPFFDVVWSFREPVELYLRRRRRHLSDIATCMIHDSCLYWAADISRDLDITRFVFYGPSCFYLLCIEKINRLGIYDRITDNSEPFAVPDLPVVNPVVVTKQTAPGFFDMPGWEKTREGIIAAQASADGVVINTFDELEPRFIESYRSTISKKVFAIGPLALYYEESATANKAARGNVPAVDQHRVLGWLDSMPDDSVVYVSFGSLSHTPVDQLIEVGLGLEASNRPFIWMIKAAELLKEWLSGGFEERVKERGLIIKGWAPQLTILSHRAVGGFVTHCGWNSTLEAVSAGVPMITWPRFADQFLNEKLVVEELEVGVSLGVVAPVSYLDGLSEKMVRREEVEAAVVRLMEGREMRERAKELGRKAKEAMKEGGSSLDNLRLLFQYVVLKHQNKEKGGKGL